MHGRTALAALLVSAALSGCGQETSVAPVRIEITDGPPPAATAAPVPAPRAGGKARRGTLKTKPTVAVAPTVAGAPVPAARPAAPVSRPSARRFRSTQLRALRAYCATRPPADPRCVDGRVDERVAFAGLQEAR